MRARDSRGIVRWSGGVRAWALGAGLAAVLTAGVAILPHLAAPAGAPSVAVAQTDWMGATLTDARNGQSFTLRDYAGQVVLLQPMAVW